MTAVSEKSFQGSWQQMAYAAAAGTICIGKYDYSFPRTIDITHEDGSVKRLASWFFDPTFTDGSRLWIADAKESKRGFLTYLNGVSEDGYGRIVSISIFPLSSIEPRRS